MNQFQSTILDLLPGNRKANPSGWISFNAVCCHNKGESRDTRKRGGIRLTDQGWNYHCFNCGFKAGWNPGHNISKNTKSLLTWLGLDQNEISRLNLFVMKNKDQQIKTKILNLDLDEKELPKNSTSFQNLFDQGCLDPDFIMAVDYILRRGFKLDWYNWHWSNEPGYKDRVIIPVYYRQKIVGWTARKIKPGNPKYLSDTQSGTLFNIDNQNSDRSVVIVVEGPLDAIAIDAVAIMTNEPNDLQITRLKNLNRPVIIVPDRDLAGSKMIDWAIANEWAISVPNWEPEIKDTADAVLKYGRIYTLVSILNNQTTNPLKQQIIQKQLANL